MPFAHTPVLIHVCQEADPQMVLDVKEIYQGREQKQVGGALTSGCRSDTCTRSQGRKEDWVESVSHQSTVPRMFQPGQWGILQPRLPIGGASLQNICEPPASSVPGGPSQWQIKRDSRCSHQSVMFLTVRNLNNTFSQSLQRITSHGSVFKNKNNKSTLAKK